MVIVVQPFGPISGKLRYTADTHDKAWRATGGLVEVVTRRASRWKRAMLQIDAKDLWTAGGVLLGFQFTALSWRISEESKVAREGDQVWLPPADYLNLLAMLVMVLGVFVAPVLGLANAHSIGISFGLAGVLFLGHAFALAGHYELFSRGKRRSFKWCSRQEAAVLLIVAVAAMAYLVVAMTA